MTTVSRRDPYAGRDPRSIPAYNTLDAAHYLRIPETTIRAWLFGRRYATGAGTTRAHQIIEPADPARHLLSFINLVEIHVLDAIRRKHKVHMRRVRQAVDYLRDEFRSQHPLVDEAMETDGINLFVNKYGTLINVSQYGQLAMKAMLEVYLRRIERDERGMAIRLFPFTRTRDGNAEPEVLLESCPRLVAIDPRIAFGRPVIAGSGIPTAVIADRFNAGDSIEDLAHDYERPAAEIQEAIRCEAA